MSQCVCPWVRPPRLALRAGFRGALELGSAQLPTAAQGNSSTWEKLDRCEARAPQPEAPHGAACACVCARVYVCARPCLRVCMQMCVHVCV